MGHVATNFKKNLLTSYNNAARESLSCPPLLTRYIIIQSAAVPRKTKRLYIFLGKRPIHTHKLFNTGAEKYKVFHLNARNIKL